MQDILMRRDKALVCYRLGNLIKDFVGRRGRVLIIKTLGTFLFKDSDIRCLKYMIV